MTLTQTRTKPLYQLRIERDKFDISTIPHINTTKLVEQTPDCLEVLLTVAERCREASLPKLVTFFEKCVAVAVCEYSAARANFRLEHWAWSGDELAEAIKSRRIEYSEEKQRLSEERWLSKNPQAYILDVLENGPRKASEITWEDIAPARISRTLSRLEKIGKVKVEKREWSLI